MSEVKKALRLSKVAREFNVGISTIVDFLKKKGFPVDTNPNTKITSEQYDILLNEYRTDLSVKKESEKVNLKTLRERKESISITDVEEEDDIENTEGDEEVMIKDLSSSPYSSSKEKIDDEIKVVGKIDLDQINKPKKKENLPEEKTLPESKQEKTKKEKPEKKEIEKEKEEEKQLQKVSEEEPVEKAPEEVYQPAEEKALIEKNKEMELKVVGKIDLESMNQRTRPPKKSKKEKEEERKKRSEEKRGGKKSQKESNKDTSQEMEGDHSEETSTVYKSEIEKLSGPTVVGKISLPEEKKKPVASSSEKHDDPAHKKKRKRIHKEKQRVDIAKEKGEKKEKKEPFKKPVFKKKGRPVRHEVSEEDVQKQIKDTLARLTSKGGKSKGSKYRREKRDLVSQRIQEEIEQKEKDKNVLKVTEFVSVNELANMMDAPVNDVIATCMNLGLIVSINQRLDAETMALVADEFDFTVEFVSADLQEVIREDVDEPDELMHRSPIVTVMGHVDHGKTSLLDYIRHANVIAGEAGGITQHIGAYNVTLDGGRKITFLDTPGHEAFTAMRARGAQITDIVIIVVSADDSVMPQTIEAINHASAAGVPIVFAINKIDKAGANPEKIKEQLANMNYMTEDWGGKYQSQEISAKKGTHVEELLEKVLLEAELLDLKANPNKKSKGTIIESSLDKGRGYVATLLVENGTLKIGDIILAGSYYGHVKAMFNERGKRIEEAGPASPALILGLNGAPQAGDKFNVMDNDREAKEIANKREQLQREQGLRVQKHITLDEIGRRIAIGNFKELNIVVKGDVDGSIEALSDSLIKLSTEQIQVNIIHKGVGQISESDILLAAASNAVVIGFQVRPSLGARKLAEKEEIDIRLYSIIYDAIEEVTSAMEGMLSPEIKEEVVATVEVMETFKITKVGTIAGCIVKEGKINRNSKIRVIREGIVVFSGELASLKRFKEDAKEVASGYECGLNVQNYNDIKAGDIIEGYKEVEVKKKL